MVWLVYCVTDSNGGIIKGQKSVRTVETPSFDIAHFLLLATYFIILHFFMIMP